MNWLKRLFRPAPPPPASPPRTTPPVAAPPDFPFPLVAVPGATAIQQWHDHQRRWRADGASAVLLGDAEAVTRLAATIRSNETTTEAILVAAARLSPDDFFAGRARRSAEEGALAFDDKWPAGKVPTMTLSAHLEVLSRQPIATVYLARIPTANPWEIPAHLKFGPWNECPAPEEHVAVLQRWTAQYGVEIYALTGDVLECAVARPPPTPAAAMALAREQYLYCNDIVDQGTESVGLLAASLLDSPAWFFWWD